MRNWTTRAQFVEATEDGIRQAGSLLTEDQRTMLRHVAATEKRVARQRWEVVDPFDGRCGCPLDAAGIVMPNERFGPVGERLAPFWKTFDTSVAEFIAPGVPRYTVPHYILIRG